MTQPRVTQARVTRARVTRARVTRGRSLRLAYAGAVTAVCFATLFARLLHLQVVERPAYAARADSNRVRSVPLEAPRGRILDRAGRVLADHRPAYRVSLDRAVAPARRTVLLRRLSALLGVPESDLVRRLEDRRTSPVLPVPLADDVGAAVVVALRERADEFAGVEIEAHPVRRYPHGTLAAHVLGTLRAAPTGPGQTGATGVEAAHDRVLRGRTGTEHFEVDSRGRVVRSLGTEPPTPGGDVRLTLDLDVQMAAEQALADGMALARRTAAAPAGAVVAVDVRDGAVVAMASAPTFDPATLAGRVSVDAWRALHDPAAHSPLTNRAVQGLYAPGSTFKPVTALAGLEAGAITPATVVDDHGSYRVGGRTFRNAQGRSHGRVDLARALAVSSDVYFYALGERLHTAAGDGPVQGVARRLGFGAATGVDIGPEPAGRVPGPAWKRAAHEQHPAAFPDPRWYPGDSVNLSIGQGDLVVTPLQLATAYAALETGRRPVPHVSGGPAAGAATGTGVDPAHRAAVLTGLAAAVSDPDGTGARPFAGSPVTVAGKTGTAEVNGKADTALFAGLVPAGAPRYAVVAVVEEAGFGSVFAAPIVRRVAEALMASAR